MMRVAPFLRPILALALLVAPAHSFLPAPAAAPVAMRSLHQRPPQTSPRGSSGARRAGPMMGGYGWVDWYLHELGAEWEDRGTAGNPNPFGSIPCLRDGAIVMFESGAILLYLADRFGALSSPRRRAEAYRWVTWANASLDPICFVETPEGRVIDTQLRGNPRGIAVLESVLAGAGPFLGGDEFGVQDVAVASYLLFVPQFFPQIDLSRWPSVSRYMLQCASRESYGKAFGPETQAFLTRVCEGYVAGRG